jgi:transcription elongation factor Elf1
MGKRKSSAKPPPKKVRNSAMPQKLHVSVLYKRSCLGNLRLIRGACLLLLQADPKLETTFNCPFCNASKSVVCTMDWETQRATVECTACKVNHVMERISHLTEPIDVYTEWLDACEEENS